MNCAFEDCTVLNQCIEQHEGDWERIFIEYERERKVNADAIADLALANFIEMRDSVADAGFALKKDVELALEKRFPDRFIPKYSMVSFHRIPYAVAQARGRQQAAILERLCRDIDGVEGLDWGVAKRIIEQELPLVKQEKF